MSVIEPIEKLAPNAAREVFNLRRAKHFEERQQVWSENRSIEHQFDDSSEAHNDYLRLALELGLAGLTLYALLFARLMHLSIARAYQNPKKYLHLAAWIIMFTVVGVSDNMLHHTPVLWLTFAWWGAALAKPPLLHAGPNLLS